MADPLRVVVEVASPEVVKRLEAEIAELNRKYSDLNSRHDRLHRTFYEFLEKVAEKQRKR